MFQYETYFCLILKQWLSFVPLNSITQIDMISKLSQKQIGQRIAELRKLKGLSQEDLAKGVKISRPSLAQIELGNRSVDILELQKLSLVLAFSLDDFMSKDFSASKEIEGQVEKKIKKEAMPLICNYGFNNLGLHRIEGIVETENKNCKNAIAKLNFKHEGTMKECEVKNGKFISLDIYAMVK